MKEILDTDIVSPCMIPGCFCMAEKVVKVKVGRLEIHLFLCKGCSELSEGELFNKFWEVSDAEEEKIEGEMDPGSY